MDRFRRRRTTSGVRGVAFTVAQIAATVVLLLMTASPLVCSLQKLWCAGRLDPLAILRQE
jgi:hypothetical protein